MEQRHNVKHNEKFSSQDNSKWNISVCVLVNVVEYLNKCNKKTVDNLLLEREFESIKHQQPTFFLRKVFIIFSFYSYCHKILPIMLIKVLLQQN